MTYKQHKDSIILEQTIKQWRKAVDRCDTAHNRAVLLKYEMMRNR